MKKLWFKAKRYGYGWYPCSWEGWLTLFIFIGLMSLNFLRIDQISHSVSDTLINILPETFLLVAILIIICIEKGEKARWRWGN